MQRRRSTPTYRASLFAEKCLLYTDMLHFWSRCTLLDPDDVSSCNRLRKSNSTKTFSAWHEHATRWRATAQSDQNCFAFGFALFPASPAAHHSFPFPPPSSASSALTAAIRISSLSTSINLLFGLSLCISSTLRQIYRASFLCTKTVSIWPSELCLQTFQSALVPWWAHLITPPPPPPNSPTALPVY